MYQYFIGQHAVSTCGGATIITSVLTLFIGIEHRCRKQGGGGGGGAGGGEVVAH